MKRKSVSGFITGLLGIIIGLPIGFYAYIVLSLIIGLSNAGIIVYSVYLFYIAGVIAILGICFYFKNAKIGGILMLVASILYLTPFLCGIFTTLINNNLGELIFALIIGNIPTALLFISAILGLKSK